MYPLNLTLPAGTGFAVANDEAEHAALSDMGYEPKLVVEPVDTPLLDEALALGIAVDKRWGDKRLAEEIAKVKAA